MTKNETLPLCRICHHLLNIISVEETLPTSQTEYHLFTITPLPKEHSVKRKTARPLVVVVGWSISKVLPRSRHTQASAAITDWKRVVVYFPSFLCIHRMHVLHFSQLKQFRYWISLGFRAHAQKKSMNDGALTSELQQNRSQVCY